MDFFTDASTYLHELNTVSIIFRLVLSVLLSGIIGLEREKKQQAAGFRTHILVSLAATLVMLTNLYMFERYTDANIDPVRMAAQVISGIGFLGAGTIIVTGRNQQQVRGLTTAASLWASACVGLAIGSGFYLPAIIASLLILGVVSLLTRIDQRYRKTLTTLNLYVEIADLTAMRQIIHACKQCGYRVLTLETNKTKIGKTKPLAVLINLSTDGQTQEDDTLISIVEQLEGVIFATVLNDY